MNVNSIKNPTVRNAVVNAIRNGRIRIATNADFNIGDRIAYDFGNHKVVGDGKIKTVRDGYYVVRDRTTGQDLAIPKKEARAANAAGTTCNTQFKVGDQVTDYNGFVHTIKTIVGGRIKAERHTDNKIVEFRESDIEPYPRQNYHLFRNAAEERPFTTNEIVANALEWCGKGKGANAAPDAKVAKNGDWGNLATIYIDRAIEAEKQGNVHEAARYKERASELMKIMRRADTGYCNVWNVRLDENGNEIKDALAVNTSTSAKTRTFAECIDAELVNDGSSANKAEARQWLEMHRDDIMSRYGREAYLDALERWNKNADIQ